MNPDPTPPKPTPVSVVIAAPAVTDVSAIVSLDEFMRQTKQAGGELLVVYTNDDEKRVRGARIQPSGAEEFEVAQPGGTLVPYLWQVGIEAARGRIVVLILAGLRPDAAWLSTHLEAHAAGQWAVVGGPIEVAHGSGLVDAAIAISRYSAFALPYEPHDVPDVAADNASYHRDALNLCADLMRDGFWEPPVHDQLRRHGLKLLLHPVAVMHHVHTNSAGGFVRQRLRHGFRFGRDRRRTATTGWIVKYLLLSPAVPLLLTWRVGARWKSKGRDMGLLARCLPVLLMFNIAWSIGEFLGTFLPAGESRKDSISR